MCLVKHAGLVGVNWNREWREISGWREILFRDIRDSRDMLFGILHDDIAQIVHLGGYWRGDGFTIIIFAVRTDAA